MYDGNLPAWSRRTQAQTWSEYAENVNVLQYVQPSRGTFYLISSTIDRFSGGGVGKTPHTGVLVLGLPYQG